MTIHAADFLRASQERVDRALDAVLPQLREPPELLHEAMRYAVLGGGKRLRPALAFGAARACGAIESTVTAVAVAVELVHAYSLVHDDLPAMDDDRERRGRPTVHVKFGEDLGILAGDALLALAFGALGHAGAAASVVARLADAAGSRELVGGQVDDLRLERDALTAEQVASIHRRKTAALFRFAVCGAAEICGAGPSVLEGLDRFALEYGAAFQIADDFEDGERAETSILRVASASDARHRALLHLARARRCLEPLAPRSAALGALVELVSERLGTL